VTVDLGPAIHGLTSDDLDESSSAADRIVVEGADALPALAVALRTEPPAVRRGVAEVVGRIDDARAIPILLKAATWRLARRQTSVCSNGSLLERARRRQGKKPHRSAVAGC
jgi:HEAT repeat protein